MALHPIVMERRPDAALRVAGLWTGAAAALGALIAAAAIALGGAQVARADPADAPTRIAAPAVHDNLAVYFVRGDSAAGPAPLTLAEAMAQGVVAVQETGEVNRLVIENTGREPVFVQAGDMVKGGRQDRTIAVSLVLPAKSGPVDLEAFCVESGRWAARGAEDAALFASAEKAMPSNAAKLAMRAPEHAVSKNRQGAVWESVAAYQRRAAAALDATVVSAQSRTSLQLTLESEALEDGRAAYVDALSASPVAPDVVGAVFAVNGRVVSADVYPSNALFRKMWSKNLAAAAEEALQARADAASSRPAPSVEDAAAFMAGADAARSEIEDKPASNRLKTHEGDDAFLFAAEQADGAWVHRSYLAKE